ncbi:MAG: hypothetical protein ACJ73S_02040 [Mycobacteriales bacterium]
MVPAWLGELSASEHRLWQAFGSGETVDLSAAGAADRSVRGAVVAALLLGAQPAPAGRVPAVRLVGATVTGGLDVANGHVAYALALRSCRVDGPVLLDDAVLKAVDLHGSRLSVLSANGAHVDGSLDLTGAVFGSGPPDPHRTALHAERLVVDGDLRAGRIRVAGSVCLIGARVSGQVALTEAELTQPDGTCLNVGGIHVGRSLLLIRLRATGEVRMAGAQAGTVLLSGARLANPGGTALYAEAIGTVGDLIARGGFHADGEVYLAAARIGGGVFLQGAQLLGYDRPALDCSGMEVGRSLYLSGGFAARGEIRLTGCRVDGHLDLTGMACPEGRLVLYAVRVGRLRDEAACWPPVVNLDGFSYDSIEEPLTARRRLRLLARQEGGYRAQPYGQLAAYYRSLGHDEEARNVLLARQRARRGAVARPWRIFGYLQDALVGYGYRPLRAVAWGLTLLVAGTEYFRHVPPAAVHPADRPHFNALLYTADLMIPIFGLGERDTWQPRGVAQAVAVALILSGWALGLAVAAAATRALTRN